MTKDNQELHEKVLHLLYHLRKDADIQELNTLIDTHPNLITDSIIEDLDKSIENKNLLGYVIDYTIAQIRHQNPTMFEVGFDLIKKLVSLGSDMNYPCTRTNYRTDEDVSLLLLSDRSDEVFTYLLEHGARLKPDEVEYLSNKNSTSKKMKIYHQYVEKDKLENSISDTNNHKKIKL